MGIVKKARDAIKLKQAADEIKKDPAKAARAAVETLKENPVKAVLAASGPEDPLAVSSAAELTDKFKKKLDDELKEVKQSVKETEKELKEKAAETRQENKEAKQAAQAAAKSDKMSDGTMMGDLAANTTRTPASDSFGQPSAMELVLFIFAVGIQIFDFLRGFRRDSGTGIIVLLYLMLAVLAAVVFYRRNIFDEIKSLFGFLAVSAISVFVPAYLYLFQGVNIAGGPSLMQWASFFLSIFPIWPVFIARKLENTRISHWTNLYISLWVLGVVLVGIFYFSSQINASTIVAAGGQSQVLEFSPVWNFLSDMAVDSAKNFWNAINLETNAKILLNASGLAYYTGTVDQNEKQPVGLYIDNVRPADKVNFENAPVIVWADLRGKSFNNEIIVTPTCFIDSNTKKGTAGESNPHSLSIFGEEHDSLQCTFGNLSKGSYTARVGASFSFETWAYVTYTFVDLQVKRSMEVQGKNVNSELDIPRYPNAIYTNGPIFLGMGSQVDQPIGVDTENNVRDPILGVTIEDRWTDGKLEHVNDFTLQVPEDFDLVDCDRWYPEKMREPASSENGYNFFKFSREEIGDIRSEFRSITCRLHIKDPKKFLAGQQKVQRTFVAQATYEYQIEKKVSLSVKE